LTGLLFEFTKNEITPNLSQFSVASTTIDKRQPIYSGQMGVFYNHKKINIVSTLNYIKKVNSIKALTIYDPESGNGDNQNFKLYHDLQTIGWTTDIIAKPFKNFELHTMFTWQQPKYQGLNVEAYGIQHDFDGKVPIGLSEFLVEIDPSYSFAKRKVKLWASFRYFSKQYASLSNLLYYKPRWETFAGVDYKISKKFSAHVKMYNLLNYAGMKGGIQNATYYTEDNIEEVYNTYQSGQTMLRRHTELTLKYKF